MAFRKFSSLVHFNGLELLARGFEPLAVMAEVDRITTALALT
jgi:hypothetical protein